METTVANQKPHTVTIVVHNEDTGKSIKLEGESTDLVQTFINKLYEALSTTQKPDDRLRCGGAQVNVFSYANLSISDFERNHCSAHEWVFAGATGGGFVLPVPVKVDEEVAAAKLKEHLEWLGRQRAAQLGLRLVNQDRMYAVVRIPGVRANSEEDDYYVRLGADFYDKWPPTAAFVKPDSWELATTGTRWLPRIQCQGINWFGLHAPYGNGNMVLPQLLCFTFTAEYYMVSHAPPADSVWRQGYHTLAATLSRLAEVLKPPHYQGPSGQ